MIQAFSPSITDADCPVSLDLLGRLYRADVEDLFSLVSDVPERRRARLAAYLYGRSHTHELGMKVAATCEQDALQRAAGPLGDVIFRLSRQDYARPSYGEALIGAKKKVSLAGARAVAGLTYV